MDSTKSVGTHQPSTLAAELFLFLPPDVLLNKIALPVFNSSDLGKFLSTCKTFNKLKNSAWKVFFSNDFPFIFQMFMSSEIDSLPWKDLYQKARFPQPAFWTDKAFALSDQPKNHLDRVVAALGSEIWSISPQTGTFCSWTLEGKPTRKPLPLPPDCQGEDKSYWLLPNKTIAVSGPDHLKILFPEPDRIRQVVLNTLKPSSVVTCVESVGEDQIIVGFENGWLVAHSLNTPDQPPVVLADLKQNIRAVKQQNDRKGVLVYSRKSDRCESLTLCSFTETKSWKVLTTAHPNSLFFSLLGNGRFIARSDSAYTADPSSREIQVWALHQKEGKLSAEPEYKTEVTRHASALANVDMLPDGRLISLGLDGDLFLWPSNKAPVPIHKSTESRKLHLLPTGQIVLREEESDRIRLLWLGREGLLPQNQQKPAQKKKRKQVCTIS